MLNFHLWTEYVQDAPVGAFSDVRYNRRTVELSCPLATFSGYGCIDMQL